jgi:hypothetical protein
MLWAGLFLLYYFPIDGIEAVIFSLANSATSLNGGACFPLVLP